MLEMQPHVVPKECRFLKTLLGTDWYLACAINLTSSVQRPKAAAYSHLERLYNLIQ